MPSRCDGGGEPPGGEAAVSCRCRASTRGASRVRRTGLGLRQAEVFHWALGWARGARLGLSGRGRRGSWGSSSTRRQAGLRRPRAAGGRFEMALSARAARPRRSRILVGRRHAIYEGTASPRRRRAHRQHAGAVKMDVGSAIPGIPLPDAADGEILAKGTKLRKGYWNMPEATAEVTTPRGVHTGDIGEMRRRASEHHRQQEGADHQRLRKNRGAGSDRDSLKSSASSARRCARARRKFLSAILVADFEAMKPWAEKRGAARRTQGALADSRCAPSAPPRCRWSTPHRQLREGRGVGVSPDEFTWVRGADADPGQRRGSTRNTGCHERLYQSRRPHGS